MAAKRDACRFCRADVRMVVRTPGGFSRVCGDACAERIPEERRLSTTHLATSPAPAAPKSPLAALGNVAEQAAVLLPGNEFAEQITTLLVATGKAARA